MQQSTSFVNLSQAIIKKSLKRVDSPHANLMLPCCRSGIFSFKAVQRQTMTTRDNVGIQLFLYI